MDLKNLAFFKMAERKIGWLNQRQAVLARNIANADTPSFMPSDLKQVSFKSTLMDSPQKLTMTRTNSHHMSAGGGSRVNAFMTNSAHSPGTLPDNGSYKVEKTRKPYEISVDKNAVVLEDQMLKMSDTRHQHEMAVTLFQKNVKMIKEALGRK